MAFSAACVELYRSGWSPVPLPAGAKAPPPEGFTGDSGRYVTKEDLMSWVLTHANGNVMTRIPKGVVGIDVDHYDKGKVHKRGGDTLAEYEQRWGELPPTWRSSARPLPSGIRFFRVPEGSRFRTKLGDAIEIIQPHHRYAVVAPSWNAEANAAYQWYGPDGEPTGPPDVTSLPLLPVPWLKGLLEGAAASAGMPASRHEGEAMLAALRADARLPCVRMVDLENRACEALGAASEGSRHDAMSGATHSLILSGAEGHPGAARALDAVQQVWLELVSGEDRGAEWERAVLGSARKAANWLPVPRAYGPTENCGPCVQGPLVGLAPPSSTVATAPLQPVTTPGEAVQTPPVAAEAPVWSIAGELGTTPWCPVGDTDHELAAAALARLRPVLRHATDADVWLIRERPEVWTLRRSSATAEWAVTRLTPLMPKGSKNADKDTLEGRQYKRRNRLMMSAGIRALGSTMRALVAGRDPWVSVELAELDQDPHVMWAGGVPYDLSKSTDELVVADIDPGTPHLHTAKYRPELERPTPGWDAFLAAVWPDPLVRSWALRVLSVAITGEADAALPILVGPTRTGKTTTAKFIMDAIGTYAESADPRLLQSGDNSHASIVFALKGKRLAFIDEAPRGSYGAQERLKQLTGGGALTGNPMRSDPVTFQPTHTLVLTANEEPLLTDLAVEARARLLPCEGDPEAVRAAVEALSPRWSAEAPGVLAQMMREAGRWLADRHSALTTAAPEGTRERAALAAAAQDPIRQWLYEETSPDQDGTRASVLYREFVAWCRNMGHNRQIPQQVTWGRKLNDMGFPADHRRDGKWRPLRLRPTAGAGLLPSGPVTDPLLASGHPSPDPSHNPSQDPSQDPSQGPVTPSAAELGRLWAVGDGSCDGLPVTNRGSVTGLSADPSQTENAAQTPQTDTSVTGVTGLVRTINNNNNNKIYRESKGETRHRGHTRHGHLPVPEEAEPEAVQTGATYAKSAKTDKPTREAAEPVEAQTGATYAKSAKTGKLTRTAAAEARRAEKRAAAAGPRTPLPAVRPRGGLSASVSVQGAGEAIRAALARSQVLTVDVETSGYPIGHREYALRTVQLGDDQEAVVLDAGDPEQAELARTTLAQAAALQAHSASADLSPLIHAGLASEDVWLRMWDTVIPAKLADPAHTGNGDGVKALAAAILPDAESPAADKARKAYFAAHGWLTDTEIDTPVERSGWANADHTCATMINYDTADVLDTAGLAKALPAPPREVHERERAVQRITARVSLRGIALDRDQIQSLIDKHEPAKAAALSALNEYGLMNPASPKELVPFLTGLGADLPYTKPSSKFPEGKPSVAAGTLNQFVNADGRLGEAVRMLLKYREHATALSTYIYNYRDLCDLGDGRARPTVYTLGADTGRMSCVRPNAQNVPREGGYRSSWVADPGWCFVTADFSSVEVRVMAALSQDPELIRQIKLGIDLHGMVSELAFGTREKHYRYIAKRGVFGWAYGGGMQTLADQLGVDMDTIRKVVSAMREIAPTYVTWAEEVKSRVRHGAVAFPTYSGRVIHLDPNLPHKSPNYLIQGVARELLVDALIKYDDTEFGGACVLPVHDEVVTFAREDRAEAATVALVQCMTTELFGVPIEASAGVPSRFWQDAE